MTDTPEQHGMETAPVKKPFLRRWLPWILAMALVAFFGWRRFGPHPLQGQPAPPFTLASLSGGEVSLAEHLGRDVILLDFWAAWCPPCRKALPEIAELAAEYAPKGVVVYTVNLADTPERVRNLLESLNIEVPVLLDPDSKSAALYRVRVIPQIVLINRNGVVRHVNIGGGPGMKAELKGLLDRELAAK